MQYDYAAFRVISISKIIKILVRENLIEFRGVLRMEEIVKHRDRWGRLPKIAKALKCYSSIKKSQCVISILNRGTTKLFVSYRTSSSLEGKSFKLHY